MVRKTLVVDEETRYLRRESIRGYLDYLQPVHGNEAESRLVVLANHMMDLDIDAIHSETHYASLRIAELEKQWGMNGKLSRNILHVMKLNGITDSLNLHYELSHGVSTRLISVQYRNEAREHIDIKVPINEFSEYRKLKSYIAAMNTYKSKYAKRENRYTNNITVNSFGLYEKLDKNLVNTFKISIDFYHANTTENRLRKRRLLASIDHLIKANNYTATILLLSDTTMNYTFYAPHGNFEAIQKYLIDSDSLLDCVKNAEDDATFILTLSVREVMTQNIVHSVLFQHNCGVGYF